MWKTDFPYRFKKSLIDDTTEKLLAIWKSYTYIQTCWLTTVNNSEQSTRNAIWQKVFIWKILKILVVYRYEMFQQWVCPLKRSSVFLSNFILSPLWKILLSLLLFKCAHEKWYKSLIWKANAIHKRYLPSLFTN